MAAQSFHNLLVLGQLLSAIILVSGLDFEFKEGLKDYTLTPKYTKHPFLFYEKGDIENMKKSIKTTHEVLYKELLFAKQTIVQTESAMAPESYEQFSGKWNEIYGNNLPVLALTFVLNDDKKVLDFVLKSMDHMVKYRDWRVRSSPSDELPVAHSLLGFATAYDMLYLQLDDTRKKTYGEKIAEVTKEMYKASKFRWWGKSYLESQVATNYLALLVGSMVCEMGNKEAVEWKQAAITQLEYSMQLRTLVKDGSTTNGVSYGTYTSRSITQFIFFAKRHFDKDFHSHPWLKNHFDFYYYTTTPGIEKIVGIADSTDSWWYGPESQLVFLDSFVMKNGHGYWLANQIRHHKPTKLYKTAIGQVFSTLHTEFLWYDPSIKPKQPPKSLGDEMHVFEDWGLVVMRYGALTNPNSTLLTFKSGKIRGKSMYDLVHTQKDEEGNLIPEKPSSFNAGHAHPDQNSFTFSSNRKMFLTDGYYGPKFTYLENSLLFSPSNVSECTWPMAGQLGDCGKWLRYSDGEEYSAYGQLIATGLRDGMFFVSGESKHAYHSSLKLQSAYRTMLMVKPELVVMVDHIRLAPGSNLTHAAAHFNNVDQRFATIFYVNGLSGVQTQNESFVSFWLTEGGQSPSPNVSPITYTSAGGTKLTSSNVNITFILEGEVTRIMYVFYGPSMKINNFAINNRYENDFAHIELDTNKGSFSIEVGSKYENVMNGKDPYFAKVKDEKKGKETTFGYQDILDRKAVEPLRKLLSLDSESSSDINTGETYSAFQIFYIAMVIIIVILLVFVRKTRILFTNLFRDFSSNIRNLPKMLSLKKDKVLQLPLNNNKSA